MTGWILNITVSGFKEHDNHRLLNYLTAPNVLIWSASCASSALPGIFDPVELHCKNEYGQIVPYNRNSKNSSLLRSQIY
jgi:predicted acylesterase/phospholipase RssA